MRTDTDADTELSLSNEMGRRSREGISGTMHGEAFWHAQASSAGFKMLQQMGWKQGKGVGKELHGRAKFVGVKQKLDSRGLGASAHDSSRDDTWIAATSAYNDLLARLNANNVGESKGLVVNAEDDIIEPASASATILKYKAKNALYSRFKKAKQVSNYSSESMREIFGKKKSEVAHSEYRNVEKNGRDSSFASTVSSISIEEYFKQKMKPLGFSTERDSQQAYYDAISSVAAEGRRGLGFSNHVSTCPDWTNSPGIPIRAATLNMESRKMSKRKLDAAKQKAMQPDDPNLKRKKTKSIADNFLLEKRKKPKGSARNGAEDGTVIEKMKKKNRDTSKESNRKKRLVAENVLLEKRRKPKGSARDGAEAGTVKEKMKRKANREKSKKSHRKNQLVQHA